MKKKILATTFLSTLLLVGSNPLLSNATELSSEKEVPVEIQEGIVDISFNGETTSRVDFQLSEFDLNSDVRKQTQVLKAVATVNNTKSDDAYVNIFARVDQYGNGIDVQPSNPYLQADMVQRMTSKQIEKDFDVILDADAYVWRGNRDSSVRIILSAQEVPNPW
ncbi:hypothetical protein ABG980_17015 [Enterococcus casseliflavus]|jgi:hypothetical protein|uniref:hypothetical protein n=1 Tax=Enterococcus TaxID=1350 RepID=UPI000352B64A|nr:MULTISPECIES: hypothetical protein [Enterococcus]EPH92117.1 hypothetical protein D922_02531 [Enterococcus faecalis 06-MB-DW-09]AMG50506.1 hypothetical protein AL523_12455 [Enterococcus gallinarum]MDB1695473.1 hypothetical protein [Enterococcus casseliflavus]MDB1698905.1 hypothetical protein [Enterococcus casseliflavus]MDB1703586.1 hypothetical protein [Enterococcus casseliflavus]